MTTRATSVGLAPQRAGAKRRLASLREQGPIRWLAARPGIVALVLLAFAYGSVVQSFSWNQTSHYALIRSLSRGSAQIDRYKAQTGDKARFHGHWYSSRAPGLALYCVPFYEVLKAIDAPALARASQAQRNDDEMIWAVGLWGNVLPAFLMLLLVRYVGERLAPGYGTAAAVTLGLGSLVLPLGTLLFSHVLSATLGFAAFVLLWRDRDGPRRVHRVLLAGLALGFAITVEYPLLFVAIVLGAYLMLDPPRVRRGLAYLAGLAVGVLPLALYDRLAFGSVWHIAYADLPPHQSGFFGIRPPDLTVAASLLFSSRGLLTLAPVLAMAIPGLVLLYRRGRRAEAMVIAAVALLYLGYNSGYYLPFGGAVPGPRFLTTVLPFLAVGLPLAYRRLPAPTVALAAASSVAMVLATLTHPLVGYQPETAVWTRYASKGFFQPSVVSAFGAGRGFVVILPFLLLMLGALVLATRATATLRLSRGAIAAAAAAAFGWALAATFVPHLGLDQATEHKIADAGDPLAAAQRYGPHPLGHLAVVAFLAALAALALACIISSRRVRDGAAPPLARGERPVLEATG